MVTTTGAGLVGLLFVAATGLRGETLFEVPWGDGAGEIGYYNRRSDPGFEQPFSEGPGGLAAGPDSEIWIADTFHDRVLRFRRGGELAGTMTRIGDVALKRPGALWVEGDRQLAVVHQDGREVLWHDRGRKVLHRLGATGDGEGALVQVEIVGGAGGELVVGDFAMNALLRFGPDGSLRGRSRWDLSGLGSGDGGRVHTLEYRSAGTPDHWLVAAGEGGTWEGRFPLAAPELQDPWLVGIDPEGRVVVRFVKAGPEKRFLLVRYDENGSAGHIVGDAPVTVTSQQFVLAPDGRILGLSFDPTTAPDGEVAVVEF